MNLSQVLSKDRFYLQKACDSISNDLQEKYNISHLEFLHRQDNCPKIKYDGNLPIHNQLQEIKKILSNNQVIIICGETGSGKTTQIPKICLDIGCGISGLIGITQPRRIAAKNCALRLCHELDSSIGNLVGYKFRFNDTTSKSNYIKIMTDGILLTEIQQDKYLLNYDTIIIDEAHERNLNIDFLLGYIKKILPFRSDLKIIISSATIDAKIFSNYFQKNDVPAPIITIPVKNFPVEIIYKPLDDQDEEIQDINNKILTTILELDKLYNGDILVFLPGEKEIYTAKKIIDEFLDANLYEIFPLYSRISDQQQQKIFNPTSNKKRIILSTNVAETSVTIPKIKCVIDAGTARIKRYSTKLKVEQLHIEKISQSSANQRAGRCGRTCPGICIRLYDINDFNNRAKFNTAEIIRSNLSAVILKMITLNLGSIDDFPFIEKPNQKYINDGLRLLINLGAIDENKNITTLGNQIAQFPIDPKIARIIIAAKNNLCINEILIIVSALSIQDPKEIPFELKNKTNTLYKKFEHNTSDFIFYINLWNFFYKSKLSLSKNKLKNLCQQYYLSYTRMNEWFELHQQLNEILIQMQFVDKNSTTIINQIDVICYERIHKSLICGLINNIGIKSTQGNNYIGIRGNSFYLLPNSTIYKKKPLWIISSQLIDINKLYAITVAQINPNWIKDAIPNLLKFHYSNPNWSYKQGQVIVNQKITLYNLTICDNTKVNYGKINPTISKEIFIYNALVNNEANFERKFLQHNKNIINEVTALEHKSRKQNILVDDDVIYNFYNSIIPDYYHSKNTTIPIVDSKSFLSWLDVQIKNNPTILFISKDYLMQHNAENITEELFPKFLEINNYKFELMYRFEPKHPLDGITINVPLELLNKINPNILEWQVPGFIREKIQLLIKNLPKEIRSILPSLKEFITSFLTENLNHNNSLYSALISFIDNKFPQLNILKKINFIEWKNKKLPDHLCCNIRLMNELQEIKISKDLQQLQQEFNLIASSNFRNNNKNLEKENITNWDFGELGHEIKIIQNNKQTTAYLALNQEQQSISLRIFDTQAQAINAHKRGVIALIALNLKAQIKDIKKLGIIQKFTITHKHINKEIFTQDLINAILQKSSSINDHDNNLPISKNEFEQQLLLTQKQLSQTKVEFNQLLEKIYLQSCEIFPLITNIQDKLKAIIQLQINQLIYPNFISNTPWQYLQHLPRYLKGIEKRIEKFNNNQVRDKQNQIEISNIESKYLQILNEYENLSLTIPDDLKFFKWNIEELRISLFAQELKTAFPVSIKRLEKILVSLQNNYKKIK